MSSALPSSDRPAPGVLPGSIPCATCAALADVAAHNLSAGAGPGVWIAAAAAYRIAACCGPRSCGCPAGDPHMGDCDGAPALTAAAAYRAAELAADRADDGWYDV